MKFRLKIVCAAILVIMTLLSSCNIVYAEEKIISGEPNYDFMCELNTATGVLTFEGLGMLFAGDVESALNIEDCSVVKEIVIKEGISLIDLTGWYGQPNFSRVKTLTIPKTLKRIGGSTFIKCESLEEIKYGGGKEDWEKIVIDEGNDFIKNAVIRFNCPVSSTEGADSFEYNFTIERELKHFNLSVDCYTGVLTVRPKKQFFKWNYNVKTVLSQSFLIGTKHFDGCYADYMVDTIVFESGVTKIDSDVLRNSNAKNIVLPETLRSIDDECFGGSDFYEESQLKRVYYEGTAKDWDKIKIGINNIPLLNAQKYFNATVSGASLFGESIDENETEIEQNTKKISASELEFTLSKKNIIFDKRVHNPTVKVKDSYGNILKENEDYYCVYISGSGRQTGKYQIDVNMIGEYEGQKTLYYFIRPKAPRITGVSVCEDGLVVAWGEADLQKNGWIDGYEVQYSTSRKFDSPQTITIKDRKSCSETIKDLREGEKYYVRVRALTFVGDGDGYIRSGWSRTKSRKAG